jgi:hypothetical protein
MGLWYNGDRTTGDRIIRSTVDRIVSNVKRSTVDRMIYLLNQEITLAEVRDLDTFQGQSVIARMDHHILAKHIHVV